MSDRHRKAVAALTPGGDAALVATSARGGDARRIRVGDAATRLRGRARRAGRGLFVRSAGPRARFVLGMRRGRVRFVGVATLAAANNGTVLRRHLRLAGFLR